VARRPSRSRAKRSAFCRTCQNVLVPRAYPVVASLDELFSFSRALPKVKAMRRQLLAVIFDCDGVLFDSLAANRAYYDAILQRLGLPPMNGEQLALAHRGSTQQFLQAVFGDDTEAIELAKRVALSIDYEPFYALMRPAPALFETLEQLAQRFRLGMATNRGFTAREVARRFALDRFLDVIVGTRDVERPKPHPDMLLRCVEHWGIDAQAAVYVGDASTDLEAAQAAGMHFIGVGEAVACPLRVDTLARVPQALALLENGGERGGLAR